MPFRPRKKAVRQAKTRKCKKCGAGMRKRLVRCKKCSEHQG